MGKLSSFFFHKRTNTNLLFFTTLLSFGLSIISIQSLHAQKKMFLFLGQSNMAGRATIEEIDFEAIPNTYLFNDNGAFGKAKNPMNIYSNIRKEIFIQRKGPVYSFAKALHRTYTSDSLLLVVNARGGTAIERFMKNDSSGYYEKTLARIKNALQKEPTATLEAIIWHQGESNRKNYKGYLQNLNKLISDYRNDLELQQLPLICGQLGLWNSEYEHIRAEISKIEKTVPNAHLISSTGLDNFDEHHFNNKSQELLGLRYARKYLELKALPEKTILSATRISSFEDMKTILRKPIDDYVMVAAHRGDWRNGVENSLQGIEMVIEMGVDIAELDIGVTADGIPILMHDKTLNRTTTCSGEVSHITYDSLKNCRLLDGLGDKTTFEIPTLEQAMNLAKGKILVNLDKAENHIPVVYEVLKNTGTIDQAIFSSYYPYGKLEKLSGEYLDSIIYMPKIKHDTQKPLSYLNTFSEQTQSVILQTRAITDPDTLLQLIPIAKSMGLHVWLNSLDDFHCAGHTDEKAIYDPATHWGWIVKKGATIIQTDRPHLLLDFLRSKNLHN